MAYIYPLNNPGGVHLTVFDFTHLSHPPTITTQLRLTPSLLEHPWLLSPDYLSTNLGLNYRSITFGVPAFTVTICDSKEASPTFSCTPTDFSFSFKILITSTHVATISYDMGRFPQDGNFACFASL